MRFRLAVILIALAVLFLLTTLALTASGQLPRPLRVTGPLVAMLGLGLVLLAE